MDTATFFGFFTIYFGSITPCQMLLSLPVGSVKIVLLALIVSVSSCLIGFSKRDPMRDYRCPIANVPLSCPLKTHNYDVDNVEGGIGWSYDPLPFKVIDV